MLLYLASYPRSGNTWSLELLRHCFGLQSYTIHTADGPERLAARFGVEPALETDSSQKRALNPVLRRRIAEAPEIVVLKTHLHPNKEFLPGEKVLHVVRHPGASLWSYLHFLRDVDQSAADLEGVIRGRYGFGSWSAHTEAWLAVAPALGPNYLRYSYERLYEDESAFCEAVSQFLGCSLVQPPESFPSFEYWHQKRPEQARRGQRDEWEANFTLAQHRLLRDLHGAAMQKLGYSTAMPPRAATLDGTAGTQPQPAPVGLLRQLAAWGRRRWQYYGAPRKTAAVRWLQRRHLLPPPRPIILHITHYKAGSQWVAEVLKQCMAAKNVVQPQEKGQHFATVNLRPGALFPTVYAARPYVTTVAAKTTLSIRQFVVIRDLRDTLVSLYFSNRYSHVLMGRMAERRAILERLSLEEGLLALLDPDTRIELDANSMLQRGSGPLFDNAFSQCAQIQRSWIKAKDRLLIRYEDLVADELTTFRCIVDYCGIQVDKRRLRKIVAANSFEAQTGRKPGQEDVMAHRRKGIVGDWRNYFTPAVTAEFKVRYGDLLILTGYEKNLNW